MLSSVLLASLAGSAAAGTILWDGRFNSTTATDLADWSWSNQVGDYQYYIHGTSDLTDYVNLSSDYKNPADSASTLGAKITIDSTSQWNSDGMLRTELIPQTDAAINEGTVYYHFSMMHESENAPNAGYEHQVCFFESHFTEMKYGLISGESGTSDTTLRWYANSESQWNVTFTAGVWHNIAYEIDFDGGSVSYYHSTGSDALTKVAGPVSVSASSNGADWHLGALRLEGTENATTEDWYFSGVYIETGELTTAVSGAASSTGESDTSSTSIAAEATSTIATTSAVVATTSSSSVVQGTTVASMSISSSTSSPVVSPSTTTIVTVAPSSATTSSTISAANASSSKFPTGVAVSTPSTWATTLLTVTRSSFGASSTPISTPGSVPYSGNGNGNGQGSDTGNSKTGDDDWVAALRQWYNMVVELLKKMD